MTEPDKNIIDLTVYTNSNQIHLYAYTALWCGPCKRIKPKLVEIMSLNDCLVVKQEQIQKADFKKNVNDYVPFFVVKKIVESDCPYGIEGCELFHMDFKQIDSIQTSDETLLSQFLSKHGFSIPCILTPDQLNSMVNAESVKTTSSSPQTVPYKKHDVMAGSGHPLFMEHAEAFSRRTIPFKAENFKLDNDF